VSGAYPRDYGSASASVGTFRDDTGGIEHIVTSTGVNDTGQFEAGLGGERLLPFEGAGVISTWQIDLPLETNRFPRSSLSDVVLRVLYTARDGGEIARRAALEARQAHLDAEGRAVMLPLATYFGAAWTRFADSQAASRELLLKLEAGHLPYSAEGWTVSETAFYLEVEPHEDLEVELQAEQDGTLQPCAGALDWPLDLPGIARFALEQPIPLDQALRLTLTSKRAPKKGWMLLLVKPG
jgi:hypothetical protein